MRVYVLVAFTTLFAPLVSCGTGTLASKDRDAGTKERDLAMLPRGDASFDANDAEIDTGDDIQ